MHKSVKDYELLCLNLLKSGLWGTDIDDVENFVDWNKVFKTAKSQSVLCVVGHAIFQIEWAAQSISKDLNAKFRSITVRNMVYGTSLERALVKVVELLRDNGIEVVLLKGQGNAQYYPEPSLRQCGDIDLYIGQDNFETAYDILKTVASEIDSKAELTIGKHFHMKIGTVCFDIHRFSGMYYLPRYNDKYHETEIKGLTGNLKQIHFGNCLVNLPSNEFNAYYIFNHLFNHFLISGVGLRHLCDLMMFLHSNYGQLDQMELKRILVRMGVLYPWRMIGGVLVDYLGLPSEEFPFYKKVSSRKTNIILRHILQEGNFGFETDYYKRHNGSYLRSKFNALKWYVTRSFSIMLLFPRQAFRHLCNMIAMGISIVLKDLNKSSWNNGNQENC